MSQIIKPQKYTVGDVSDVRQLGFWYNHLLKAWCKTDEIQNEGYWIGLFDNGKFDYHIVSDGQTEIKTLFQKQINILIDKKILIRKFLR